MPEEHTPALGGGPGRDPPAGCAGSAVGRPFELKKSQSNRRDTFKAHAPGEPIETHVVRNGQRIQDREAKPVDPDFENENSIKLGPDRYGAFPLRSGARAVMSRAEIEQRMAESATSVYPELTVAQMLKDVFISEIELIDPALTGPEGARRR